LSIEIAAGIDRLLHPARRVIAVLRIEQGKEEVVVDRRIQPDAEEFSRGGGPAQRPRRQFEIPRADTRSLGTAARILVQRILVSKGAVGVDDLSPAGSF
jgi:hypothetical protein